MRTKHVQSLMAVALLCGLGFGSANLFAQRVPVGPPVSVRSQNPTLPSGAVPLPPVPPSPGLPIGLSYDGIDFLGSNCSCLPPDTSAAVGNNFVIETVNLEIRIFDKTTANILLDAPLAQFFGAAFGGQPYVVYDDIANRWYISGLDSSDTGFLLAVSRDSNPLDGFDVFDLTNVVGGFADYQKPGYNRDAIFISFNNFKRGGNAAATIVSIDKAQLLSGTLTYYVSTPAFQFRAMPPAQMHGDTTGGVEWFVSTDGTDVKGTTIRVTKMAHYLSNSPNLTYTSLPVSRYQKASTADQPVGPGTVTVFPNTTTTQVHFRNGDLLTAMASAAAADGFVYPKGRFYHIKTSPNVALFSEGLIDPGPGVAVQMPTVDMDSNGHLA